MITHIDSSKCIGCGICVERCPLDTLRLNVYVKEIPPCQYACPAKVNIRGYIYLLKQGEFKKAIDLVRESLPFPAITCRICFHPCERKCLRKKVDEAVNIKLLERFISDYWLDEKPDIWPRLHSGEIAVVGSGAAGLSAAYFLTRMGYKVTVFESEKEIGGMLRTSISEVKVPRYIFEAQINYIREMGVEFKVNTTVGSEIYLTDLKDSGYKVIFLAFGGKASEISSLLKEIVNSSKIFEFNPITFQTNIPYIFVGGTLAIGKAPLVNVIASAKIASQSIDRFLKNEVIKSCEKEKIFRIRETKIKGIERKKRIETQNGISEEEAMNEAGRCITCGAKAYIAYPDDCMTCFECELECPLGAIDVHPFKEQLPPTI